MVDEGPSDPVAVEFELTPEEWIEANVQHSTRSAMFKAAKRRVRIMFGLLLVLLALLGYTMGSATVALTWLVAGGVGLAVLGPALDRSQRRQLKRFADEGIGAGMFGRHRVELRPEGVLDSTDGYEWLARWPSIERVEEGDGAFLIYSGPNRFLLIPHSAFPDSATVRHFADTFYALRERARAPRLPEPGQG
jgi:YcxB-like protein